MCHWLLVSQFGWRWDSDFRDATSRDARTHPAADADRRDESAVGSLRRFGRRLAPKAVRPDLRHRVEREKARHDRNADDDPVPAREPRADEDELAHEARQRRDSGERKRRQGREPAERSAAASQPSPVVLVGNPEEWFSLSLESILAPRGYVVKRTYTGAGTVAEVRRSPPDAIVLAVELPDVNGYVLCRTLRSDPAITDSTPIVLTNAGPTSLQLRLDALRAGANDYVIKPFNNDEFLRAIARVLQCVASRGVVSSVSVITRSTI